MNAIIHMDEIFLKGSNQPFFYRQLKNNLENLLPGVRAARVEGGMWLENIQPKQLQQLAFIPGFANYAEAVKTKSTIEYIKSGVDSVVQLSSRLVNCHSDRSGGIPYTKRKGSLDYARDDKIDDYIRSSCR